ncbi:MAG: hypothetical protein V3U04_06755 [Candidatus Aerophobetes bacterium]
MRSIATYGFLHPQIFAAPAVVVNVGTVTRKREKDSRKLRDESCSIVLSVDMCSRKKK